MKKLSCLVFFCLSVFVVSAQDSAQMPKSNPYQKGPKKPITDRLYFGGTVGLMLGSYTSISIWPMVGYKFTPKLSAGLQPGYDYVKYNAYGTNVESSSYGLKVFARYRIIPQFYLHAEYATINYEIYSQSPYPSNDLISSREFVPFLFLGGGLSQQLGENSWAYIQVLFDVLQDANSPYSAGEPLFSIGFGVGF